MEKLCKNNREQKLTAYSIMAGALIIGGDINAQIVYNDIDDETIEAAMIDDLFLLDMDEDGTTDFIFRAGTAHSGTWTFASVFGFTSSGAGGSNNRVMGYAGVYYPYASALNSGYVVGPKEDFLSYPSYYNYAVLASVYDGATYGLFGNEGEKFLGVQFEIGDDLHYGYGWVRLEVTTTPLIVTIKDYAYENTPDAAIETGSIASLHLQNIPEDQIFAYSSGNTIKIIVKDFSADNAVVTINNVAGQSVYSDKLNVSGMQISLTSVAKGIYTVQIQANYAVYTKQVFINN